MISSNLPLGVLLLLAGLLRTEAAIFESVIQEALPVHHQGNVVGLSSDDRSSDPLQPNGDEDLECRVPFIDIGGRCLEVEIYADGPWSDMVLYCEEIGGQLLKMDSIDIFYSIRQYIKDKRLPVLDYWIGGSDLEEEGNFVYLDGTPMIMGPPFWKDGEPNGLPNENCVEMWGIIGYLLNDGVCEEIKNVICEQIG